MAHARPLASHALLDARAGGGARQSDHACMDAFATLAARVLPLASRNVFVDVDVASGAAVRWQYQVGPVDVGHAFFERAQLLAPPPLAEPLRHRVRGMLVDALARGLGRGGVTWYGRTAHCTLLLLADLEADEEAETERIVRGLACGRIVRAQWQLADGEE
jgi:hypothetical protein